MKYGVSENRDYDSKANKIVVDGYWFCIYNSFEIKDQLKKAGYSYNGQERAWCKKVSDNNDLVDAIAELFEEGVLATEEWAKIMESDKIYEMINSAADEQLDRLESVLCGREN